MRARREEQLAGRVLARPRRFGLLDYWCTSIRLGLRGLAGREHLRGSLARIVNPLSYPRMMEYALVHEALGPLDGKRVLDIGSPKLPALLLARTSTIELHASDLRDYFIAPTAYLLERAGLGDQLGTNVHLEVEDARSLSGRAGYFDAVYSISVLEHIPDGGDSEAMMEIARVLRPGGRAVITVPYRAAGYFEEWVSRDVYERRRRGREQVFYQRHYDDDALRARLIVPSGLVLEQTAYFGEPRVRFERYWNRIPMLWKSPLLWAQPFLAGTFLRRLAPDRRDRACGVALTFVKASMGPPPERDLMLEHAPPAPVPSAV